MWKTLAELIFAGARQVRRLGNSSASLTKDAFEKGKAVRRIILLFISSVWLWLLRVCVLMYLEKGALDVNFTYLCIAVTTMIGSCYAFYFAGRSSELTGYNSYGINNPMSNIGMDMSMGNMSYVQSQPVILQHTSDIDGQGSEFITDDQQTSQAQGENYQDHNVNP